MPGPYAGVDVILLVNSIVICPGNSCRFSSPCGVLVAANVLKETDMSNGTPASHTLAAMPDDGQHTRCRCGRIGEWKDTHRHRLGFEKPSICRQSCTESSVREEATYTVTMQASHLLTPSLRGLENVICSGFPSDVIGGLDGGQQTFFANVVTQRSNFLRIHDGPFPLA